jgi:hypothetical protein
MEGIKMRDEPSFQDILNRFDELFESNNKNNNQVSISISNAKPGVHSVYLPNGDHYSVLVTEDGNVSII